MSEHLPTPDPDFPDCGREERDIGGDWTWVVVGLVVALLALIGGGWL